MRSDSISATDIERDYTAMSCCGSWGKQERKDGVCSWELGKAVSSYPLNPSRDNIRPADLRPCYIWRVYFREVSGPHGFFYSWNSRDSRAMFC